ncbi:glycerol-3-phosphate responsive antiterminator [Curtobacterium sp. 1P10AnD]
MVGGTEADVVVTWLAANTRADGVLSTKSNLVRAARRAGLVAVQRFFLVDSFSYHRLPRVVEQAVPDAIEILPGCVPGGHRRPDHRGRSGVRQGGRDGRARCGSGRRRLVEP